jgi:hypothetical protein
MKQIRRNMKTATALTAPPIAELAFYSGDEDPAAGYVVQSSDDRFPGAYEGPLHPEGEYLLLSRDTKFDGSEWITLATLGYMNTVADDSFFAVPQAPKPFRVPASKVRRTRKVSAFTGYMYGPTDVRWRAWLANLFGTEAAEAEWARVQLLGATNEERITTWVAERNSHLEAGLIPA